MNANADLERRLADYYATEAPPRAPDPVLASVLATTGSTRQRRALTRVPWRFPTMNSYAKAAIAVVAVIAIGALGIAVLRPGTSPGVGGQGATPTLQPSPSASPAATRRPTQSPRTAPALTQTFTSTLHGVSMSYPEGWIAQAATAPWTGAPAFFRDPPADFLYDPTLTDHLFLSTASQPIGDSTPDEWVAEHLYECAVTEATTVDGATGLIGADDCNMAAVTTEGRGWIIWLYTSDDPAWLTSTYDRAWFEEVLATVQLQYEDAVGVPPSASP